MKLIFFLNKYLFLWVRLDYFWSTSSV